MCKCLLWLLVIKWQWSSKCLTMGMDCLYSEDARTEDFYHFPGFFFKLPTTQAWEKINLLGQWWTTLQKIQKISKLIKTHLYYPKIFFLFLFFVFLFLSSFLFSLFLSFRSFLFFLIFLFCLISQNSNTSEPDRWLLPMMVYPSDCANSSQKVM